MKINTQWLFVAFVAAAVVTGLRWGTIRDYRSLLGERDTVTGRITDIQASRRVKVVRYSYDHGGKTYTGETTGGDYRLTGVPVQVTISKADPSVSTLDFSDLESRYKTSLVVVGIAVLPLVVMLSLAIAGRFRRNAPATAEESA